MFVLIAMDMFQDGAPFIPNKLVQGIGFFGTELTDSLFAPRACEWHYVN